MSHHRTLCGAPGNGRWTDVKHTLIQGQQQRGLVKVGTQSHVCSNCTEGTQGITLLEKPEIGRGGEDLSREEQGFLHGASSMGIEWG